MGFFFFLESWCVSCDLIEGRFPTNRLQFYLVDSYCLLSGGATCYRAFVMVTSHDLRPEG